MAGQNKKDSVLAECVAKGQALVSLVEYAKDSIVSKTILNKSIGSITLFAFGAGQSLSEKGFARASGPDQENVGFLQLNPVQFQARIDPFVVVVNGYGQNLFCPLLIDDILVEDGLNLRGLGNGELA